MGNTVLHACLPDAPGSRSSDTCESRAGQLCGMEDSSAVCYPDPQLGAMLRAFSLRSAIWLCL